jgi:hypothetical protein
MRFRIRLIAAAAFAALALGVVPLQGRLMMPEAQAQNFGQRVVNGVVDSASGPVAGATVFLRNAKTKGIRSYTSSKEGRFRFAQVTMTDDFELWAEKDGKKSTTKTISSWDNRKEIEAELKMK